MIGITSCQRLWVIQFVKCNYRHFFKWILVLAALYSATPTVADDAPDAPGRPSVWAPAAKDFLGTSMSDNSKVCFTGAEGIVTEVFYPTLDMVQNVDLQLMVMDAGKTWEAKDSEQRKQKQQNVSLVNKRAMNWQIETTADNGKWKIKKKVFTDPNRNSLIQRFTFQTLEPGKTVHNYYVYVLNRPAINNLGGKNNSRTMTLGNRTMFVASKPNSTSSALAVSLPWQEVNGHPMISNGFVGGSDGWSDLFAGAGDKTMDWHYEGAYDGNVAQMGRIDFGNSNDPTISFDIVLAFGGNENEAMSIANDTLNSNLDTLEQTYINQWTAYCNGLNNQNGTADDQYYLAAMTLKCIQDKSNGAMIAGPGTPWGESQGDNNQGGYHLVWSRDLFKFASALLAAGDSASANKAVEYLFNVQMQTANSEDPYSRIGRFPQNSFVNGKVYWNGTQMDETAMPIILAWKLKRVDLWPKIKLAADFLVNNGPRTDQERWEEMAGYSPSTIAAEIAGLVCAASLAQDANDPQPAKKYLKKADEWRNNVASWTFTTNGFHNNGNQNNGMYYIRINADQNPNDDVQLPFGNGAGSNGERYIIDGGFLELVRMGVMSPNDWTIMETLPEYDAILKQTIPGKGEAWFRYNYDGYGETNDGGNYDTRTGRGRLWPIFTAERGIYEIARLGKGSAGTPYLSALKAFSSPAGFIPEQIWNNTANITGWQTTTPVNCIPGTATRSMRPLSWAMGEYINLVAAMNQQHSDAPTVVCQRYATDKPQTTVTFEVKTTTQWGQNIYLVGDHPLLSEWAPESAIKLSPKSYPNWTVTISLPANMTFQYKYIKRDEQGITTDLGNVHSFTTPNNGAIIFKEVYANP